jgi:hypothetical protein
LIVGEHLGEQSRRPASIGRLAGDPLPERRAHISACSGARGERVDAVDDLARTAGGDAELVSDVLDPAGAATTEQPHHLRPSELQVTLRPQAGVHRIPQLDLEADQVIEEQAFVGPLLPHFINEPHLLDTLLGQLAETGVREVYMEHINLKRYIRERMNPVLANEPAQVQEVYLQARTREHREQLDAIVAPLLAKHGLQLRFDEVVYHDEFQAKADRFPTPRYRPGPTS